MDISQLIAKAGITPNGMQTATIDAVQNGSGDVFVLSSTGTGKTLAYLLPVAAQTDYKHDSSDACRRSWA